MFGDVEARSQQESRLCLDPGLMIGYEDKCDTVRDEYGSKSYAMLTWLLDQVKRFEVGIHASRPDA